MATAQVIPHILLITGAPGVGKTTVLRRVAEGLGNARICGFYTEELREQGVRRGFHLVGFDGNQGIIAHVDLHHRQRVGKYGVDVAVLDRLARTTLALHEECAVYLVDEIGKMECLSPGFVAAMRTLLESNKPLVATIGKKGGGFIGEVKARGDVELLEVTRAKRDALPREVLEWLARHGVSPDQTLQHRPVAQECRPTD
jgi:nucleoside-triphosphatase